MERQNLRIGELARLVGVTAKTIRHYHEIGLLEQAQRSESGYRLYSTAHLRHLHRIKRLKDLGLPLRQIQDIFNADDPDAAVADSLEQLYANLTADVAAINDRLAHIKRFLADGPSLKRVVQSGETSTPFQLAQDRAYLAIGDIAMDVVEVERAILAELEAFDWPAEIQESMQERIERFQNDADIQAYGRLAMQRMSAIKHLPEDAAEIVSAAWEVAQTTGAQKLRDLALESRKNADMYRQLFSETTDAIAADLYTPAQNRFLAVVEEMLFR